MIISIFRYFFFIICMIYTYLKLLNIKGNYQKFFSIIIFSLLLSISIPIIPKQYFIIRYLLFPILYFYYIFLISKKKTTIILVTTIISFAISYMALTLAGFILATIVIPLSPQQTPLHPLFILVGGIIQFVLIHFLFSIKRLKNGMPFILNNQLLNIGIILSSCVLGYFIFLPKIILAIYPLNLFTMTLILFLALLLLIWWRRKITQSYVEKLRISEVEALYKEISDKDLEIEKLHVNNDELARIIHKDNKLIPAMELAVRNYLQAADSMTLEDVKQMGKDLLTHLERMSEDRQGIIHTYQEKTAYHQRCGLASIDAIVDYMEKRASDSGIEYHYQYDKDIKEKLSAYINETDAMHLLSDIIENAIIATTDQDKKMICVHIGFIQDILFMDISDSGIAFDPETYQNFGILKSTTHADHGGSGIGLMDLGRLKKQYKFSLQIYEYSPDSSDYTKKIRLLFDKKNHYLIQSYRAKEISSIVTRNDLHIFSSNNKEQRLFHI